MIFNTLQPASFRGVSFLVSKADTEIGRKQAEYNYPFSDKKKIEDLGLKPRTYKLTCVIHGSGSDYAQKRDALLRVLEDGVSGDLIHPFYGLLQNMVARPATMTEDLTSAGVITIDVTFDRNDEITQPLAVANTLSIVEGLNSDFASKAEAFLTDNLGASFVQNIQAAGANVTKVATFANTVVTGFNQVTSKINEYKGTINAMTANPISYALNAAGFSGAAMYLLNNVIGILPTAKDSTRAYNSYFTFGDDFTPVPETTPARREYNNNQTALKVALQSTALANAQLTATLQTYATVDDIDNANTALENQFNKVLTYNLDEDLLATLSNLRAIVNNFLEEQKLTAAQVTPIFTNVLPATVLSYQYYGTTDRADEIIALNNTADVSFIEGNINVLSA